MGKYTSLSRAGCLARMGFASYVDYLRSSLWAEIRARILARDAKCVCCGADSEVVHHKHYGNKVMAGQNDSYLHGVCRECHRRIEFRSDGEKRTFRKAKIKFIEMRRKHRLTNS